MYLFTFNILRNYRYSGWHRFFDGISKQSGLSEEFIILLFWLAIIAMAVICFKVSKEARKEEENKKHESGQDESEEESGRSLKSKTKKELLDEIEDLKKRLDRY